MYGLIFLMSLACQSYAICMSIVCTRMSRACHSYVTRMRLYFIFMDSYAIRMSLVCTHLSSVCHSYVLVCNDISFACTRMPSICYLYVLLCYSHITRMYLYVIRMPLVYTYMSSVCYWYVLCVIRMPIVCGFTINFLKNSSYCNISNFRNGFI